MPCHNEQENLRPLTAAVRAVLERGAVDYEIIVTDDASTDDSWRVLQDLARAEPRIRVQRLARNCGESAASWAGIKAARGSVIVTMDADLQNDPADLPRFLEAIRGADCVCGNRVSNRAEGDHLIRVATSRMGNWVRNWLSNEDISDSGCTYRAFRRECVADIPYFKGMHRFLPTLVKMHGFRVTEIPVGNRRRMHGRAHYGFWNRLVFLQDLLAVRWMQSRMQRFTVAERLHWDDETGKIVVATGGEDREDESAPSAVETG